MKSELAGIAAMVLATLLSAAPGRGQQPGTGAPCEEASPLLTPAERSYCFALAQAAESAQPQLGIIVAGGNPTIGTAGGGGLRLGVLPRVSATAQLSAVRIRLPDVRTAATSTTERLEGVAPALSGTVTVGILPGVSIAPTLAGIASVDLIASAAWLPFNLVNAGGFASDNAEFAYGLGGRLGLLRESFVAPAVSVSLTYRRLGQVRYGDVCPQGGSASLLQERGSGYDLDAGLCASPGDPGEFASDLSDWSARAVVSKQLLGFGVAGGVGHDRLRSRIGFGLGATPALPVVGTQPVFVRASNLLLEQDRWSAFANGSFSVFIASVAVEAGWLQGGSRVRGFPETSAFDPGAGT
ncbi:MAG: hypothetical protein M3409_03545, partial [Gemmatimonadota bacterium]|nr:hypothetical protein [Gemmatimonadota bacterium]